MKVNESLRNWERNRPWKGYERPEWVEESDWEPTDPPSGEYFQVWEEGRYPVSWLIETRRKAEDWLFEYGSRS